MEERAILVTGSSGEIGHNLITYLAEQGEDQIVAIDRNLSQYSLEGVTFYKGDIRDDKLLEDLEKRYEFHLIYHLAGILSTGGEQDPATAHEINVDGSFKLLNLALSQSERHHFPVKFVFPSTMAVYGLSKEEKAHPSQARIKEHEFLNPITIYGANKLYVEHLGRYYANFFRFLDDESQHTRLDFRCLRFPGIFSSDTIPTGGTSDYGPELIHAAAQGKPYESFVTPETRLPFMAMPDAVSALIKLVHSPRRTLKHSVYNVSSFSLTAEEIYREVLKYFPKAKVSYLPHAKRLQIVESWPGDMDDTAARTDWGWNPQYSLESTFADYLIPGIIKRYSSKQESSNHVY